MPGNLVQLENKNIAVCNQLKPYIQIFDTSGNFIEKIGSSGTKEGEFIVINNLIQLIDNNIAVCDSGNKRIQILDISGKYIEQIDGTNISNNLDSKNFQPTNLIQLEDENIAVTDYNKDVCSIRIFDLDNNNVGKITIQEGYIPIRIIKIEKDILGILKTSRDGKYSIDFYSKIIEEINTLDVFKKINYKI